MIYHLMTLSTSIPKLDDMLDGGLQENKSVLLLAEPGVRSVEFAQQLFYHRLKECNHGVYFVNNKSPAALREQFQNYGWDLDALKKKQKLFFIDGFSQLASQPSTEEFVVNSSDDTENVCATIQKAISKFPGGNSILVFDSLSSFLDTAPEGNVNPCLKKLLALKNTTSIFLFTSWLYPQLLIDKIREQFDCIIELKAVERRVIVRNYFTVSKASWLKQPPKSEIPFKVLKPGGVHVYVPKILVTGPYSAGKTSFVHSASVKAVSVDRLGTTVALDHGKVLYQGMLADLFGTPGQERFDPILEMLGGEALGVIIVLDSTAPETFTRAKEMLQLTKTGNLPAVIVANKANLKGALSAEDIRNKMSVGKEVPIIPVVAQDLSKISKTNKEPCALKKEDVQKVLDKLFEVVV